MIEWRALSGGTLSASPVTLAYRTSDSEPWQPIAAEQAASGTLVWTTPRADTRSARVRATVRDRAGVETSALSSVFVIDSEPPLIRSVAARQQNPVRVARVNILTEVVDLTAVTGIQVTAANTRPTDQGWRVYEADYEHVIDARPGEHILWVHVRDSVGHVSAPAELSVVLADDVVTPVSAGAPPVVLFLAPAAGSLLTAGSPLRISLHVHDVEQTMPQGSVSLAYSVDNRRSWVPLAEGLTPSGNDSDLTKETLAYSWQPVPNAVTGTTVLLQVTARDAEGQVIKQLSPVYNMPALRRIAGGVFDDNGVSARFSLVSTQTYYSAAPLANLVRRRGSGDLFLGDLVQGLRVVDGASGIIDAAPPAAGSSVISVARDDSGRVYGCNDLGIFSWNDSTKGWDRLLSAPCDWIAASKSTTELLYWMHDDQLFRLRAGQTEWVAFNGTLSGSNASCYRFDDPRQSCAPREHGVFAVDASAGALLRDYCESYGDVSGCSEPDRVLRYNPDTTTLGVVRRASRWANLLYRSSNDTLIGTSQGVWEEDPVTGDLYLLSEGVVRRYRPDQPLIEDETWSSGLPREMNDYVDRLAGVRHESGDGGPALAAHLGWPAHVWVGHPAGPERDMIFVQSGRQCCWDWSDRVRVIDPISGRIEPYGSTTISDTHGNSGVSPLVGGGLVSLYYGGAVVTAAGELVWLFSGPTACAVSPADGQPAAEANWPRPNYYDTNYHTGLSHTDGNIYLAGFRNANAGSCDGRADVMIKRFSFDPASGARGVVEHVAGVRGTPTAAELSARGEPAWSFRFRGSVRLMRENLTAGAGGAIFIYQGQRIRMITRVDPGNLSSWTIRDVTKPLSGVDDFVIDTNVGADGRSGTIYFVDGGSQIHRYALGSGAADDLEDDEIIAIGWNGMDDLNIVKLARLSSGEIVFGDGKAGGQVYGYNP